MDELKCYDMRGQLIKASDIVQLRPEHPRFPGQFVILTDVAPHRCMGFMALTLPSTDLVRADGLAFVFVKHEDFERVGACAWVLERKEGDDDVESKDQPEPDAPPEKA